MSEVFDLVIIGGGIVGLATAYQASLQFPQLKIGLLEKEVQVGLHQSGHNSGVLHAGLYYKPGSFKAKLAVSGLRDMIAFCEQNQIAYDQCGKLVVATNQEELARLQTLFERGQQNGLKGLRMLSASQIKEREPHVSGLQAIEVPEEGIVSYPQICSRLAELCTKIGVKILLDCRVNQLKKTSDKTWLIKSESMEVASKFVISCGGLYSDKLVALSGKSPEAKIVPFRGEYYKLRSDRAHLVKHLIYPVPDPSYPFLGVHFTRRIEGGIEAGPNAVLAMAREGYSWSAFNASECLESLSYQGLWSFLLKHKQMCWEEFKGSLSKSLFTKKLQALVPEIQEDDLVEGGAGVRAQAMNKQGELIQDFHFVEDEGLLHVVNAPSPGATASLAIAKHLLARAQHVGLAV